MTRFHGLMVAAIPKHPERNLHSLRVKSGFSGLFKKKSPALIPPISSRGKESFLKIETHRLSLVVWVQLPTEADGQMLASAISPYNAHQHVKWYLRW